MDEFQLILAINEICKTETRVGAFRKQVTELMNSPEAQRIVSYIGVRKLLLDGNQEFVDLNVDRQTTIPEERG